MSDKPLHISGPQILQCQEIRERDLGDKNGSMQMRWEKFDDRPSLLTHWGLRCFSVIKIYMRMPTDT